MFGFLGLSQGRRVFAFRSTSVLAENVEPESSWEGARCRTFLGVLGLDQIRGRSFMGLEVHAVSEKQRLVVLLKPTTRLIWGGDRRYRKINLGENEEPVKKESLKVVEKDFLCV